MSHSGKHAGLFTSKSQVKFFAKNVSKRVMQYKLVYQYHVYQMLPAICQILVDKLHAKRKCVQGMREGKGYVIMQEIVKSQIR